MRLMDVITAYLYGSIDNDIHMKIPQGFKLPKAVSTKPRSMFSIKLQRSLYGLKQSRRVWYNRLSEYLLKEGYVNNLICPCVFIKKSETGFSIIAVYVDDLNLVGTPEELTKPTEYLKKEFEMIDLGKTKFCIGLQIEHFPNGVLVHQSTYIKKILKCFNMDKAHPLSQKKNYSDMQMQDIFQIRIKLDHKPGMFLTIMELLSHGDLSSRQWWLQHQIIQKLLQFTKLVVNAYVLDG